ncbi:hypothetical protein FEM48_Zijuj05G0143100 [Ziziphus jujuba var. spinosa]|uniref:Uncharacterized protein n=1 Tax=Ziziphus jujuba var. spinosa TaxID=714518 RepID=A0A978VFB3_ZIZJJ|nr:hypothetical protein FEM48_Zijuj05G0143100 [Ziziphus jujuba var. spinosa]
MFRSENGERDSLSRLINLSPLKGTDLIHLNTWVTFVLLSSKQLSSSCLKVSFVGPFSIFLRFLTGPFCVSLRSETLDEASICEEEGLILWSTSTTLEYREPYESTANLEGRLALLCAMKQNRAAKVLPTIQSLGAAIIKDLALLLAPLFASLIDVVSVAFEGQSAVNRQRMVYKAIWEELLSTVHSVDRMAVVEK